MSSNVLDYCEGDSKEDKTPSEVKESSNSKKASSVRKRRNPSQITVPKNLQSNFRGVCWNKSHKSWHARIEFNGRREHLGYFNTAEDAARAYDRRATELFGKNAIVNFDESLTENAEGTNDSNSYAPYYCGKRAQKTDVVKTRERRKRRRGVTNNDEDSTSSKTSASNSQNGLPLNMSKSEGDEKGSYSDFVNKASGALQSIANASASMPTLQSQILHTNTINFFGEVPLLYRNIYSQPMQLQVPSLIPQMGLPMIPNLQMQLPMMLIPGYQFNQKSTTSQISFPNSLSTTKTNSNQQL